MQRRSDKPACWTGLFVVCGLLLLSSPVPTSADDGPGAAADATRVHALLVNGGGTKRSNYNSHLRHLKVLIGLLDRAGVARERITVLASDGDDAAPDLAVREEDAPERSWLLPSRVASALRPPIVYANSEIDGIELLPATRQAFDEWFDREGAKLRPGDILLLYVTDHGKKNADDLSDNTILLWNNEQLGVKDLSLLLAGLAPGVRVVEIMSQCYSGAFAHTIWTNGSANPQGNVCGYFSVPADRQAYGCYPEAFRELEGHSVRLFEGLEQHPRLPAAHSQALLTDRSPDVPFRTSDFYLEQVLRRAVGDDDEALRRLVDEQLAKALASPARWEPELRLLDRLGEIFGFSSPRSLADLQQQTEDLEALGSRLETYADRWEATLEALRSENWRRFQAAHPGWGERLTPTALAPLDWPARRALAVELLDALAPFTESHSAESHSEGQARFAALRWRADEARALHFRNDVRLGVVLRMRGVLVRIAGLHYLEDPAREAERGSFAALSACEDLPLGNGNPAAEAEEVASPAHFPSLQQEQQRMEAVSPAWLGINYQPVRRNESNASLPRGAVTVLGVYPDSPAERAGLEAADVIVGTPAGSFVEAHAIREWVMRREVGQAAELELLRAAVPRTVTILPSAYPLTLPELHARPSPGSLAPKLLARRLDGGELPASGGSRLLFFWASWCPVCERALPEVLALSGARDLEIVAVSDEDPTHLQAFLDGRSAPFPALVAADQERGDFRSYGVSGTPTIVIVDAEGRIEHYQTGYASGRGIEVPGWTWKPAPQESK